MHHHTTAFQGERVVPCFACAKCDDSLSHFMRCSKVSYIFQLPYSQFSIHTPYFTPATIAKLSVLFEVHYLLSRRYGKSAYFNIKTRSLALHVAIKNKLLKLSHITYISYEQAEQFIESYLHPELKCSPCFDILDI